MRVVSLSEVKARLSTYIEQARKKGPVVITRNGKAVAVIITPTSDDDLEGILLSRSPKLKAILEKSRSSIRAGDGLSEEEFWNEVIGNP